MAREQGAHAGPRELRKERAKSGNLPHQINSWVVLSIFRGLELTNSSQKQQRREINKQLLAQETNKANSGSKRLR